jgi:hypothetical protein
VLEGKVLEGGEESFVLPDDAVGQAEVTERNEFGDLRRDGIEGEGCRCRAVERKDFDRGRVVKVVEEFSNVGLEGEVEEREASETGAALQKLCENRFVVRF